MNIINSKNLPADPDIKPGDTPIELPPLEQLDEMPLKDMPLETPSESPVKEIPTILPDTI